MVYNALQAVFMVITLVAVGYFLGRSKWNSPPVITFISRFVVNITVPCTVISVFLEKLSKDALQSAGASIFAALIAMGASYVLSMLIAKIARIDRKKRGVFSMMFALSNAGFMGLPVAEALYGADGMLFALCYFAANGALINSLGYVGICADGIAASGESGKIEAKELIKRIFSPPVIAVALAFIIVLTEFRLPRFLEMSIGYLGDITSPLALLFLGLVLADTGFSCIRRADKNVGLAVIGRFLFSPLLMFVVAAIAGMPHFESKVFIVQTALPSPVATTIYAKGEGADIEFAAAGVVITTLLSLITIPVYMAVLA